MQEQLTFDDVLISPCYSTVNSRKEVSLDNGFSKLPIISANMDSITGSEMAKAMKASGALACLHRFWSIQDNVTALENSVFKGQLPWVSVGVGELELERARALFDSGARHFIVDVAHGAQLQVARQYDKLKELMSDAGIIAVGNFGNSESIKEFCLELNYRPDLIKVGIGPGSACITRIKTGCGEPQLSAIADCASYDNYRIPIIADGGMKTSGDIAKALAAGAKMVMLGGMLAGTDETPGNVEGIKNNGYYTNEHPMDKVFIDVLDYSKAYKKYRGSASKEAYEDQGKEWATAEGESFQVPYKGPVVDILKDIEGGLQSAFSYVGARNLEEFQQKAKFVRVSNNSVKENGAHGK